MKLNIFELFIRRPVLTVMLNAALVVFGVLGLTRLPVRELPDIDPPVVNVLTVYPGAAAEVVETEVTERLEEAISSAEGIRLLTSESREQVSSVSVEFQQGRDVDVAAQDVRDRVARVRGDLPDDIDEPVIAKQDAGARPIMWVAFFSDRYDTRELTRIAEDQVKDRLQTVDGVSSVIVGGSKRFAMRVRVDPLRMAAHEVTVLDIERAMGEQNVELPSGRIEAPEVEMTILTQGQLLDVEQFGALIIRQEGTRVVRLRDVARVEEGVEDERTIARFNGKPTVGLGIVRQSRANTVEVAEGVRTVMTEILPTLPLGIEVDYPYDEAQFISRAIREVWETLGIAFLLVVLTIFLFLRNLRSTLLPALAIPVSIVTTFGVLFLLGFSINIFTLLALVLAIGLVVDDAIVVLENIVRHIEMGEPPFEAAIHAMREIAFAVIVTTLSLAAVFLPLVFIGGVTGRLLLEFAVSLAVAVIVSSVVALSLAPMTGARILRPYRPEEHGRVYNALERFFDRLNRRYERALGWALRHRPTVLGIALASLALSAYFFLQLDREFLPEEDKGRLLTVALTPEGSTPGYTDRMMRQLESIVGETDEVTGYFTAVALPFNGPGDPTTGFMFVRLRDGERPPVRDLVGGPAGLGARFFTEAEGAIAFPILPKAVDLSFGQPFQLVVMHPDLEQLDATVRGLTGRLREAGFLGNVRSTFEMNKPEVQVHPDRARAGVLGVSVRDVARSLQILFGGLDVSDIKRAGKQYEVIVQLDRDQRQTPQDLRDLYVRAADGSLVQLSNLVEIETSTGPNVIERFQRQRAATIEGTPAGMPLGSAMDRAVALLEEELPDGFAFDWKGEARSLNESSADLYLFLFLAILVVYMVLGAQFESFVHPFVVMLALPLALVGAFGLLYGLAWVDALGNLLHGWTHYAPDAPGFARLLDRVVPRVPSMNMNIFSQVGLILLVGLVTKNSILLVEFANQLRARGLSARDAIFEAGKIRLRPILMTSLATIMGILPIAIGFGEASESRRPLGVVAVGGMISSTILTLLVIPVIYTFFSRRGYHRDDVDDAAGDEPAAAATPPEDPAHA